MKKIVMVLYQRRLETESLNPRGRMEEEQDSKPIKPQEAYARDFTGLIIPKQGDKPSKIAIVFGAGKPNTQKVIPNFPWTHHN